VKSLTLYGLPDCSGVRVFVCLQSEVDPTASEKEWKKGGSASVYQPYFHRAERLAAEMVKWPKRAVDRVGGAGYGF
jgi:hypothetical protein